MPEVQDRILILSPRDDLETIRVLSSEVRLRILDLLSAGPHNVNEIAEALSLPQSTVATNVLALEEDMAFVETIHANLVTGLLPHLIIGRSEFAIGAFHETIGTMLRPQPSEASRDA